LRTRSDFAASLRTPLVIAIAIASISVAPGLDLNAAGADLDADLRRCTARRDDEQQANE